MIDLILADMGIYFGGFGLTVSQKLLHLFYFHSVFQKMRGDTVPKGVNADFGQFFVRQTLAEPGTTNHLFQPFVQCPLLYPAACAVVKNMFDGFIHSAVGQFLFSFI